MDPINLTLRKLDRNIVGLALVVVACFLMAFIATMVALAVFLFPAIAASSESLPLLKAITIVFLVIGCLAWLWAMRLKHRYRQLVRATCKQG